MIITDPVKIRKLVRARRTPYLPMLSFDIHSICADVLKTNFPGLDMPINIYFVEDIALACIVNKNDSADIFIHVLLNDPSTPIQVCKHIVTHELIHLIAPCEMINGKEVSHTPAFWQHEMQMVPERSISSVWIWRNFFLCLRRNKQEEGIRVKKNWKTFANKNRLPWEYFKKWAASFELDEKTL